MSVLTKFSYLSCRTLVRPVKIPVRSFLFLSIQEPRHRLVDPKYHKKIYEFKSVDFVMSVVAGRFIPLMFNWSIAIPVSYFYSGEKALGLLLLGLGEFCVALPLAIFFFHTVGKIYVNKKGDLKEIVVCSVGYAGQRVDRHYLPGELLFRPLGILNSTFGFVEMFVKNHPLKFKVNVKYCEILDEKAWKKILIKAK